MNEIILVVEDEASIVKILKRGLGFEGYQVETEVDGDRALERFKELNPDLVILDLKLPGLSGMEICRNIRKTKNTPILILTAAADLKDKVFGLDAGADDYITKPFELDELLARVRALLRRTKEDRSYKLTFVDLVLDTSSRQAIRSGRNVHLSKKEYELLELLMRNPRQVLTREVLFDRVWDYDFGGESNVLDVYIRYLREKLELPGEGKIIHTVRGVGYILREE